MTKPSHALAVFLSVFLGLSTPPSTAEVDPVASDAFKFTWFGVPVGEVTLHYGRYEDGSYEDPTRAFGLDSTALTGTSARSLKLQSRGLADGEQEGRASSQSHRLGALEGRTNGLIRWLKRYKGAYSTTLTPGGSRYEVTAMDQGAPELRDIWFGAKHSDIPKVLDFRDRSSADPLQALTGVDEGSVDPVRLMALILKAIESQSGCPAVPKAFRVFDGKRRYDARLSEMNWTDTSGRSEQANTNVGLEVSNERGLSSIGSVITSTGGLIANDSDSVSNVSNTVVVSRRGAESALGQNSHEKSVGDQGRRQLKLEEIGTSVAQESERLTGPALQNQVPHTVECRLTLLARDVPEDLRGVPKRSEIKENGKRGPAESSRQTTVDPIEPQKQGRLSDEIAASNRLADSSLLQGTAESRRSAGETEYENGQQSIDLTTRQGLIWPFNRKDLTVDFSVSLNITSARFRSFLIRSPVGQIKGRLTNEE